MGEISVFIPAGGLGTRLHPHTLDTPKPLLPMGECNRRIIDHPLDVALSACDQVFVSTDYLGYQIQEYLEEKQGVTTLTDEATIGSGGSLIKHYPEISCENTQGDTVVLPSDHIYTNFSLKKFWQRHLEDEADITLLTVSPKSYGEYVSLQDDRPSTIETKPRSGFLSTTGIFLFSNRFLSSWIQKARQDGSLENGCNIYRDIVCPSVGSCAVSHYFLGAEGYWEDVGTPERYHSSNMRISGNKTVIASTASVSPYSTLEMCVVLDGTTIDEDIKLNKAIVSSGRYGKLVITQL